MAGRLALVLHVEGGEAHLALVEALVGGHLLVGGKDGIANLRQVKRNFRAVALDDLHQGCSSVRYFPSHSLTVQVVPSGRQKSARC